MSNELLRSKIAKSLKNYEPSHPILIKASNMLNQQAIEIQMLKTNRHNWKIKAEKYEKKYLELESILRKAQEK